MKKELTWKVSRFEELTIKELYGILYLRCKVFVLEQNCPYLDTDYKDQKALHLHGYVGDELVAYSRIFKGGDYFDQASIGRVIVAEEHRKYGYGHDLISRAINVIETVLNEKTIVISAQAYLQKFYEAHSFVTTSETYLEDGIPHISMKKE
ncbi:hypothetical protein PPL_05035 [Heterostelium album PN500]|uniref:N-acetyltransferase domain-containing protein n=1 Tax=Heterostelium pallidum (strain ATCC 26659 / Pp 5 / PN500) TaxID=670386 RepID=D3B991_HETP5|nr:hypothetical protein PPL_05035 [Heterostelium album PN500]EFA82130.1 hypothetical protein PPL_05035 [Heterostelium album PN500]|eukprot:XP_020434247.1 hypothetical protein PPL_05035 [Heterostelium album PN500]